MKIKKYTNKVLIIFFLLIAVIIIGLYWQKNNLKAAIIYSRYSPNEIEAKINDNSKELSDELKTVAPGLLRDMTQDEKKKIADGKVSADDILEKIIEEKLKEKGYSTETDEKTPNFEVKQGKADDSNIDDIISEHISKMYSLKSYYLGQIGGLESQAKAEYKALPKDKRTISAKKNLISKYYSKASSLESQCDSQVYDVLASLKSELKKHNEDTSIVDKIKSSYENEKSLKKAYYFNLLK